MITMAKQKRMGKTMMISAHGNGNGMKRNKITRQFFSLIEMLVVIAVIAILAGMTFGVLTFVDSRKKNVQTMSRMQAIRQAILEYEREYKMFPYIDPTFTYLTKKTYNIPGDGDYDNFFDCLEGKNEKGREFLPPFKTNPRKDLWGQEFGIILDADFDGKVLIDSTYYNGKAHVISYGASGKDADDLRTWKVKGQ